MGDGYRSDSDAAQARVVVLEERVEELAHAEEENEALRARVAELEAEIHRREEAPLPVPPWLEKPPGDLGLSAPRTPAPKRSSVLGTIPLPAPMLFKPPTALENPVRPAVTTAAIRLRDRYGDVPLRRIHLLAVAGLFALLLAGLLYYAFC